MFLLVIFHVNINYFISNFLIPFLDNPLFYSEVFWVTVDINYEILLIFFEFKLIFPFFCFRIRRRSTNNQTRFIFYMVGADRLDL